MSGPDAIARSLFVLAAEQRSGVLAVDARARDGSLSTGRITLDGGWIHALANIGDGRRLG